MAISNKNNVTLRSETGNALTFQQGDANFQELKNVIDDTANNETNIENLDTRLDQTETDITELESGKVDVGGDISQNTVASSTGAQTVAEALDERQPVVNGAAFGMVGDYNYDTKTGTDNTQAYQNALDFAETIGGSVYIPGGAVYMITDTIYYPPTARVFSDSPGDNWSRARGTSTEHPGCRIKLSPTEGTKRIWTDVGQPGTPATELVDSPISVGGVLTGPSIDIENITFEGGQESDGSDSWDVILMLLGGSERSSLKNVEFYGYARIAGYYEDATWSNQNTKLLDLHANTYGRAIQSGGSNNELFYQDCWFFGGDWGFYRKGTERTDISANIWAIGGVSDENHYGCRFGNRAIGAVGTYSLNSGCYYRDLHNGFQNRYFYGCSFRSGTGTSVFLDRGRHEYFFGMYGEQRADRLNSQEVSYTVDTLAVVATNYEGRWPSSNSPVSRKVYLSETTRLDVLSEGIGLRVTWETPTGSCVAQAYGYDSSAGRAYILTDSVTGTISAGQTITQAAGQDIGLFFYATDRAEQTFVAGQSTFATANQGQLQYLGAGGALISGNFRTEGIESTGHRLNLGSRESSDIDCDTGQVNLWINRYGTVAGNTYRLRYLGSSLESYDLANLGSGGRRFDTGYFLNAPNVSSDKRLKTDIKEINEIERKVAAKLKTKRYKMKRAVEEKGFKKARYHFGYIAQEVIEAFESEGLDPWEYGVVCCDEEINEPEELDSEGNVVYPAYTGGGNYSVRYEELHSFVLSALIDMSNLSE